MIENKAYGVSDSDLAIMQTDPTLALTLNDLETQIAITSWTHLGRRF